MHSIPQGMGNLLSPSEFQGEGWIQARLFFLGSYPGAVASPDRSHRVRGELYQLLDPMPTLARLDRYEGCGPSGSTGCEYERVRMPVALFATEKVIESWVYLYCLETAGLPCIEAGDYRRYLLR